MTDRMTQAKRAKTRKSTAKNSQATPRTRFRADVRSQMIVEAAFHAIAKEGFEGLRTRDIANLVGINIATLHHHFPTKEDLIAAIASYLSKHFREEKTQPTQGETAVDALKRQAKDAVFYHGRRPEMLAVYQEFVGRAPRDPMIQKLVQRLHATWHEDVEQMLRQGKAEGSLRSDLDPKAAAGIVISTVWGLIAHVFVSPEDFDDGFDQLTKWILAQPGA